MAAVTRWLRLCGGSRPRASDAGPGRDRVTAGPPSVNRRPALVHPPTPPLQRPRRCGLGQSTGPAVWHAVRGRALGGRTHRIPRMTLSMWTQASPGLPDGRWRSGAVSPEGTEPPPARPGPRAGPPLAGGAVPRPPHPRPPSGGRTGAAPNPIALQPFCNRRTATPTALQPPATAAAEPSPAALPCPGPCQGAPRAQNGARDARGLQARGLRNGPTAPAAPAGGPRGPSGGSLRCPPSPASARGRRTWASGPAA